MSHDATDTQPKMSVHLRRLMVAGMFLLLVACMGTVVSLVWFLSTGKYLSATFCLLATVALSHAAGRFVLLVIATRAP